MQIEVTARHVSVSEELKAYAEKKAQRLLKYYNKMQLIRVLLDANGSGFRCEMIVEIERGHDLVGATTAPALREAIDQTTDHVERQLVEHKDRTRQRKGRGPHPHQPSRT